jgi:hypothetical protein
MYVCVTVTPSVVAAYQLTDWRAYSISVFCRLLTEEIAITLLGTVRREVSCTDDGSREVKKVFDFRCSVRKYQEVIVVNRVSRSTCKRLLYVFDGRTH